MTRPAPRRPTPRAIPVGTDADEQQDAGAVLAESSRVGRRGRARRRRAAARRAAPGDAVRRPERRVSLAHRLYNGEAGLDVVGHSRLIYKITAVVVLICVGCR